MSGSVATRRLPVAVWTAAALLGWVTLGRGWLPHDAGVLGQAAERVLAGELPHRDFHATYTGGLAFLNALAFRWLGVSLFAMRLAFFAAFLLWIPLFHAVARRLAEPWTAAAATLLAAAVTLPAYPEGMPSWYNLFLATAGVWALLRHDEDGKKRWIFIAGAAGGVSMLFKIVGLFFLAGAFLYLLHHESLAGPDAEENGHADRHGTGRDRAYRGGVWLCLAGAATAVVSLVSRAGDPAAFVHFGVPPLAALAAVAVGLRVPGHRSSVQRLRRLAGLLIPLAVGAAIPIVLFLVPFAQGGALTDLWQGVFVLPQKRFLQAAWSAPSLLWLVPPALVVGWILAVRRIPEATRRPVHLAAAGLLALGIVASGTEPVYRVFWSLFSASGAVVALAVAWTWIRGPRSAPTTLLILTVFAFHDLVQVPFAAPIYALYAFPLLVLLGLAATGDARPVAQTTVRGVAVALLAFTLWRVDTGFLYHLGFRYRPHDQTERLGLERAGGIRISPSERAEYEALVALVDALDPGDTILALPDSPEVYFLTGRGNPTPLLFDFLDPAPDGRTERILALLDRRNVGAVVVNRRPLFSEPLSGELLDGLRVRYPNAREVGRFLVAWKERAAVP